MKISVAIPSSVLTDSQHLRDKTAKLGVIARVCSIYRVSNIYVFNDVSGNYARDGDFSKLILEYLETPQYLRRTIFPLMESLRYAGALPPLRIPHHKSTSRAQNIRPGEIREGLISRQGNQYKADAGLGVPIPIEGGLVNTGRHTVLFTSSYPNLKCKVVDRDYSNEYWGYRVIKRKSISELLKECADALTIITSRDGQSVEEVWDEFC
ncbi:MAG: putative RNA uridine N3 methyltransferase, partial [Nitrososphaerales archaeon]